MIEFSILVEFGYIIVVNEICEVMFPILVQLVLILLSLIQDQVITFLISNAHIFNGYCTSYQSRVNLTPFDKTLKLGQQTDSRTRKETSYFHSLSKKVNVLRYLGSS